MIDTRAICLAAAAAALVSGCSAQLGLPGGGNAELQQERALERRAREYEFADESIFDLMRAQRRPDQGVAVNRYLWQASLDVLSFLPLEGADPFSGVITTGWGSVGGGGAYRATVYISEPALDARALKVAVFRQAGGRPVPVGDAENRAVENAILTRARQMRIAAAERG